MESNQSLSSTGVRSAPGRETAALIQAKDWAETPLGPREGWPRSLEILVDMMVDQPVPMVLLWGPELVQIYNDGYGVVAGSKHPAALGQPVFECWPEVRPLTQPLYERVLAGESVSLEDCPFTLLRRGVPEEAFLTVGYSPVRDDGGRVAGILAILRETTDKVKAEREAARNAERLSLAIESADLGTWEWDAGTDLMTLSPRVSEIFGIPEGHSFTRARLRELLHPEDAKAARGALEKAVAEGGDYEIEYRVRRPDGTSLWVATKGRGVHDASGKITRMLGVQQDITARKRAEEERELLLRKVDAERARLSAVFQSSPAFMCILRGAEHTFEFANDRYYQLIGRRGIIGKTLAEALPEVAGQGYISLLDQVYATREPFVGRDRLVKLRPVPGAAEEERYVDFVYQPIVEADGTVAGIFVHGVDITENKRMLDDRERLLESERAARSEAEKASLIKDDFLATVSHELRTPLSAILGWTQILREPGAPLPEDLEEGLKTIEKNALIQARIIEDLLDMSRIVSGKLRLEVRECDLAEVIRAGIETVHAAAGVKGIHLAMELDPREGKVKGDANRLQQVVWNLLSNAVKFTPPGGEVRVALARVDSHLEIRVTDTGEGIPPELLPFVFDRFRQADSSITRRHGGLGLGLSIVKQLVDLHGGSVRVTSPGLLRGATFTVSLPSARQGPQAMTGAGTAEPRQGIFARGFQAAGTKLKGVRVLAVDDEPDARALMKRLFEECGAVVSTAASVAEALRCLETEPFDVLVSDIGMPGDDGYTLIGKVRGLPAERNGRIPAVALTAYARAEDRAKARRAGFQAHLSKPVQMAELLGTVAALTEGK